ncbi:MAG: PcfJ domain-containing protein [Deltaproteobacteria bacterium]|nr:PcfJ domain-containing protein [Deltaproteobacteria bacterium]
MAALCSTHNRNTPEEHPLFELLKKTVDRFDYEKLHQLVNQFEGNESQICQHLAKLSRHNPDTTDCLIKARLENLVLWLMDEGHARFSSQSLVFSVEANLTRVAERLSRSGPIFEVSCGDRGTVLHVAIENQNHELLRVLLQRFPGIIEAVNAQGQTAVEKAWELRDYKSIGIMLESSAFLLSNCNQKPFLTYAILENDARVAKELISRISRPSTIECMFNQPYEEFLIDLIRGRDTRLRREIFRGFSGTVLETAIQANADEVVRTFLKEGFDIDFNVEILTRLNQLGHELGTKLAKIVSEMDASDFRLETIILLLRKAFEGSHVPLMRSVLIKLLEFSQNNLALISKLPRLLVLVCEVAARFSAVEDQTLPVIKLLLKLDIMEQHRDWLTRLIDTLARINNFRLISKIIEEDQLRSIISPSNYWILLFYTLSWDDLKPAETLVCHLPEEFRNVSPDIVIDYANLSDRIIPDAFLAVLYGGIPRRLNLLSQKHVIVMSCLAPLVLRNFSSVEEIDDAIVRLLGSVKHASFNYFLKRLETIREKAKFNKNRANLLLTRQKGSPQLVNCFAIRSVIVTGFLLRNFNLNEHSDRAHIVEYVLSVFLNSIEEFITGRSKPNQIFTDHKPSGHPLTGLGDAAYQIHRNFMIPQALWYAMEKYGVTKDELRNLKQTAVEKLVDSLFHYTLNFLVKLGGYSYLRRLNNSWHRFEEPISLRPFRYKTWPALFYPVVVDNHKIVCLASSVELDEEGRKLKHCVGSMYYDDLCSKGSHRVISIRNLRDEPVATVLVKLNQFSSRFDQLWNVVEIRGYENCLPDSYVIKVWENFQNQVFAGEIKINQDIFSGASDFIRKRESLSKVSPLERFLGMSLDGTLDQLNQEYRKLGVRNDDNTIQSFVPCEEDPHYFDYLSTINVMAQEIFHAVRPPSFG